MHWVIVFVTVFVDVSITEIVPSLKFVTYATLLGGTCPNDTGDSNSPKSTNTQRLKKWRIGWNMFVGSLLGYSLMALRAGRRQLDLHPLGAGGHQPAEP